jgi:hypothetical protein
MAKVKISLSDLRYKYIGAGVYTVISDESVTSQPANGTQVQLIVGSSKVGQVNRPFYIEKGDLKTFRSLFGTIDKTLERRGSFFHRSAEVALQSSPILAMNVVPLNNTTHNGNPTAEADTAEYQTFSVDTLKPNCDKRSKLFASYFQKERFYIPKKEYLLATRQSTDKELFSLVNIGSTPLSFIITKAGNTKRYDITVRDWYSTQGLTVPAFLKPDDLISDSFITVTAVVGDYSQSKYATLSNDTTFSKYFTKDGLKSDMYERFLSDPEVAVKFSVTGSIIPNLIDSDGSPLSIDSLINNNVLSYGVIAAVDEAQLDRYESGDQEAYLDLVGHRLLGQNGVRQVNLLSYNSELVRQKVYSVKRPPTSIASSVQVPEMNSPGVTVEYKAKRIIMTFDENHPQVTTIRDKVKVGVYCDGMLKLSNKNSSNGGTEFDAAYPSPNGSVKLRVENVIKAGNKVILWLTNDYKQFEKLDGDTNAFVKPSGSSGFTLDDTFGDNGGRVEAGVASPFYEDYKNGLVYDGLEVRYKNGGNVVKTYVKITQSATTDLMTRLVIEGYKDETLIQLDPAFASNAITATLDLEGNDVGMDKTAFIKNLISVNVPVEEKTGTTSFVIKDVNGANVRVGNYIVGTDADGRPSLVRISAVKTYGVGKLMVECLGTINFQTINGNTIVKVYRRFETLTENLQVFCLGGFNIRPHSLPDGTLARYRSIMEFMTEGSVGSALLDPEMVNFRYFVDTYAGFVENSAKSYLTRFLSRRQKCLGILNAPTVEAFRKSVSPRFTQTPTAENPLPELSVDYIISGGNIAENPQWLYTLPSEADGASFAGFFFPSVQVRDNDGQVVTCPPAPFVAATMMRKFGTVDAYKPVAGVIRGQLQQGNVVGVDYQLSQDEYRKLIEAHINPMILKSGQVTIYGNKTAYSKFVSGLNNIFVRDALIDIQNETEALLEPYVFDYNDDIMRSTVSTVLRKYYSTLRDTYRIIESYELVFDRTNNPDEFIDAGAAVVDVVVTFTSCAQKFISRISIKNRSVSASSFVVV